MNVPVPGQYVTVRIGNRVPQAMQVIAVREKLVTVENDRAQHTLEPLGARAGDQTHTWEAI